ncbi:hypothetical protein [Paraburkholderia phytofirmans]|uniref:Uncharacterized protein n=1 Tax=Paraburkholderia phytofirmans (strain DSM 17436 / LMG 22146 / PsJN) TaxID=398527 RepID=B2TDT6_PARPJ|nr:hypothetical protein [Paraburkholderia phytofirmans]ACD19126.1 hypothetical protein Bphyt_4761 [Paraburkholderia phytofirmans PsJN]
MRQRDAGTPQVPATTQRFARSEVLELFRVHACVGTHKTSHPFDQIGTPDHAAARASVIIQTLA